MSTVKEKLNGITKKLETVSFLIEQGILSKSKNVIKKDNFEVTTIDDKHGASIVISKAKKKGDYFPIHCHDGIIQYLICTEGSFIVDFVDSFGYRFLHLKECVSVPPKIRHKVTALEDNSTLIGICIPEEKAYTTKE
jgi:quercetin dioxygenase-like cupin family protein